MEQHESTPEDEEDEQMPSSWIFISTTMNQNTCFLYKLLSLRYSVTVQKTG
jgi:hypothetical protein